MRFTFSLRRALLVGSAWLALLPSVTFGQAYELCARHHIAGLEFEKKQADAYVSGVTSDVSEMSLYVTSVNGSLYLQSNYRPDGAEYPIKLSVEGLSGDLKSWARTLVSFGGNIPVPKNFSAAYDSGITFYLDRQLFATGTGKLKVGRLANAYIVDNNGGKWRARFDQQVLAELAPRVFLKIPTTDDIAHVQRLVLTESLDPNQVKLLPMILDEQTLDTARQKLNPSNLIMLDSYSTDALAKSLAAHRGSAIFVLGHFDKSRSRLAVTDAYGKEVFNIGLDELASLEAEYGVRLFPFGCETARSSSSVGTLMTFNSVDAVQRFGEAIRSTTWADLLKTLARDDLDFVVNRAFVEGDGRSLELTVVERRTKRVVGTVRLRLPYTGSASVPSPTPITPPGALIASVSPTPVEQIPAGSGDSIVENSEAEETTWPAFFIVLGIIVSGVAIGIWRWRNFG